MAGTLDRDGKLTLMLGAVAGHTAGQDLAALGHKAAETGQVLIIDMLDLIYAELADLAAGFPRFFPPGREDGELFPQTWLSNLLYTQNGSWSSSSTCVKP